MFYREGERASGTCSPFVDGGHGSYCLERSKSHRVLCEQPTEPNTYADIDAAYECLRKQYGAKEEEVVLYGQSVGSGPTLDLAAKLPRLRAVVLHSPILSGLRVMYPVKRTYWFDIYKVSTAPHHIFSILDPVIKPPCRISNLCIGHCAEY